MRQCISGSGDRFKHQRTRIRIKPSSKFLHDLVFVSCIFVLKRMQINKKRQFLWENIYKNKFTKTATIIGTLCDECILNIFSVKLISNFLKKFLDIFFLQMFIQVMLLTSTNYNLPFSLKIFEFRLINKTIEKNRTDVCR